MNAIDSLRHFTPEIFLLVGAFAALLLDLFSTQKRSIGLFGILILLGAAFLAKPPEVPLDLFEGLFRLDQLTHVVRIGVFGILAVTLLISIAYSPISKFDRGEYYSLFLFLAFALVLMGSVSNLLMIFLAIEFVSIISYLLVGFLKKETRSKEASIKYLLYGSLASGIMLFGMSLLFGISGSLDLQIIGNTLRQKEFFPIAMISFIFMLVGLGFKISMAPFHMWAPDVYEAAPTPVTAFLTVAPKAIGFVLLIRVLSLAFFFLIWKWRFLIMALSILTMTLGNIAAISQNNIKRLLAYSSIAQAGYILMGVVVFDGLGLTSVLVYLAAYAFTNLGAFTVVLIAYENFKSDDLPSYTGLSTRSPWLAACLTIFLLSLAGIPPLAGFIAKFFVFSSAIQGGYLTLAIIAAINSAIAAYYYFRVIRVMYLSPAEHSEPILFPASHTIALAFLLIGTIAIGLFPGPLYAALQGIFPLI